MLKYICICVFLVLVVSQIQGQLYLNSGAVFNSTANDGTNPSRTSSGSTFSSISTASGVITVVAVINNPTASAVTYKLRGIVGSTGAASVVSNYPVRKVEF